MSEPMPVIEVGDWVLTTGYPGGTRAALVMWWDGDCVKFNTRRIEEVLEIRKANGVIWRKEQA
jgi:thiamine monophosphate kinase